MDVDDQLRALLVHGSHSKICGEQSGTPTRKQWTVLAFQNLRVSDITPPSLSSYTGWCRKVYPKVP